MYQSLRLGRVNQTLTFPFGSSGPSHSGTRGELICTQIRCWSLITVLCCEEVGGGGAQHCGQRFSSSNALEPHHLNPFQACRDHSWYVDRTVAYGREARGTSCCGRATTHIRTANDNCSNRGGFMNVLPPHLQTCCTAGRRLGSVCFCFFSGGDKSHRAAMLHAILQPGLLCCYLHSSCSV